MKNIIAIIGLLLVQPTFAQLNKNLGDFHEIKVFDRISVVLVPASENRIEITGSRSKDVEIVNKNGQLKIRMPLPKLLNGEEVMATIYSKGVRSIDVSEGSSVESASTIEQPSLDLTAKEGAQIKLTVAVKNLAVKSVTGGIIKLSGRAENQDISIGTGGIVAAKTLETSQTSISINAGGEADINATDLVSATVRAGGDINIYGNPKEVSESTTLGGRIVRVKE